MQGGDEMPADEAGGAGHGDKRSVRQSGGVIQT
jgi:hypothetical protein